MDVTELVRRDFFAFSLQIGDLARDKLKGSGSGSQFEDYLLMRVSIPAAAPGGNFEGLCKQGIAGEDSNAFPEHFVIGGFATTKIIVIHGRQVVVDQRIGMNTFDRAGQGHGVSLGASASSGGGQAQSGAHSFSSRKEGVPHGLMDRCRAGGRWRQKAIQRAIDRFGAGDKEVLQIEWWLAD
jgi:hypothetical protein